MQDCAWIDLTQVDYDSDESTTCGRASCQGEGNQRNEPCKVRSRHPPVIDLDTREKNEIDTLRRDSVKFDDQRFLTLVFDHRAMAKFKDFCADVKR